MDEDLMRPKEVAVRLGMTVGRVYQLLADGSIPSMKIGRSVRVPRAAFDAWMDSLVEEALAKARAIREAHGRGAGAPGGSREESGVGGDDGGAGTRVR